MVIIAAMIFSQRETDHELMRKIPDECPSFINWFIARITSGFA